MTAWYSMFLCTMGSGGDILGTNGQDIVGGNSDGMGGLEPSLHLLSQIDKSHYHRATIIKEI